MKYSAKENGLQDVTGETAEVRQERKEKQRQYLDKFVELDSKGEQLNENEIRWLLENVLFLPNEKPGPGVLPKGELRDKPLKSEALLRAVNIFFGKMAQSASSDRELLELIQDHHPDKLSVFFQKKEKVVRVRESFSKLQILFNKLNNVKNRNAESTSVNSLRQQMSHLVNVILTLNTQTDISDKSIYDKKQIIKQEGQFPHLYETDTIRGLFYLLKSFTLSITSDGEDLFRSTLPKKSDTETKDTSRRFTPNERKHNLKKLNTLQMSLTYFEKAICKETGINQFNLHWFTDSYIRYLFALKARFIYEIYSIKYAEGTSLEARKQELWKTLKIVNFLLEIKEYLTDFTKLSRDLRIPGLRLNIMEGPSLLDIQIAVNQCRRSKDFKEKESEARTYFSKGMRPNDLINMLMKQAIIFARIPYLKKHALLMAEIMESSVNINVQLSARRIKATILETAFKFYVVSAGAIKKFRDDGIKEDLFMKQIQPFEAMRSQKEQEHQRNLAKELFQYCLDTIDKYATEIKLNTQSTIDPFRKMIWIIQKSMDWDLLDMPFIMLILEKGPKNLDLMKKNIYFPQVMEKTDSQGVRQKIDLNERFNSMANRGLKLIEKLKTKHSKLSRKTEERTKAAEKKEKRSAPQPEIYQRRASDKAGDQIKPAQKLYKDAFSDGMDFDTP